MEEQAAAAPGNESNVQKAQGIAPGKRKQGESNAPLNPSKKKKPEYIYGNYPSYYGYRVGHSVEEDPRIGEFKREWFDNRACLDIGCNQGNITIAVAAKFCCKTMLGVDIDSKLIFKARKNLQEQSNVAPPAATTSGELTDGSTRSCLSGSELMERVSFRTQNYLTTRKFPAAYDTIMCLSVTKWIHLNWGDDGLLKFFAKMYEELRPGGILVLEPQPWESYGKKRKVSETARKNFNDCQLKPHDFPGILTEKTGFKSVEKISSELPNDKAGFRRPLFIYRK